MHLLTWKDIRGKIQRKHGIETDADWDEEKLIELANEAINVVESTVVSLNQDYYLVKATVNISSGQLDYDLPSDMYASKIRRVYYKVDGYEKQRIHKANNLDEMEALNKLRYQIFNYSTGRKLELNKAPTDATLTIYYTRNSNRLTLAGGDSQICDIPEYADAVMAWMSYQIKSYDESPIAALAEKDFNRILNNIVNTLSVAVNDENNIVPPDTELYDLHI